MYKMQRLEVSGAVRPIYGSLGVKRLITATVEVKAGPIQAQRAPGIEARRFFRQSTQKGGKVVRPTHRPPLLPRD